MRLTKVVPLGISSPIVDVPFAAARHALEAVIESNDRLFDQLDVDRFFFSVRPYYKPYMVGRQEYRGANAGDFSGINELDLLLGLCRANDPYYAQLLVDKMQFMPPQDQARLRECMRHESFLDELLALARTTCTRRTGSGAMRGHTSSSARCSGGIASQHHDKLVKRFIERPAAQLAAAHLEASPPADHHCRCCCVRSKCCATCGWRPIAPTSRRGMPISSVSGGTVADRL